MANKSENERVGANLRRIRMQKNRTMKDCAEVLNVSYQQIQNYEKGQTLSYNAAVKLSGFLSVPLESFWGKKKI